MPRSTGNQPGISTRLARRVRTAGDRLFRASDTRAAGYGWRVTAGRSGLSRTYRDPRFDLLAGCPDCRGSGQDARRPCSRCAGSGRIRLREHRLVAEVDRQPG